MPALARFIEPVLEAHDREKVQAICYANVEKPDRVTERLRRSDGRWRDIVGMPDEVVAELIRKDGIDILVNLTGHMPNGRLAVMAMKPAPVQVNYIGYPNTFGMAAVDWRITDAWHDPPELRTDRHHAERLLRIGGGCWCYRPSGDAPAVNPQPPCERTGRVTFASTNRLVKVTPGMIRVWAKILEQVPNSDLRVTGPDDELVWKRFEENGVPRERMRLAARKPMRGYLEGYGDADILLDTFPHAGHTTTCDAAWMGVPTVTLAGKTSVSRAGVSVLSSIGLEELIAETEDQYLAVAVELARDRDRLAAMRRTLREQMRTSPLMDARRLAGELEESFRTIWRAWAL